MPWATGKQRLTDTYAWFLATWAKRLSWSEVARAFHTSWDTVFRSVVMAVAWGRAQVRLDGVRAVGLDEVQWQRGHTYLTVVYPIDEHCQRLLWMGEHRTIKTLLRFFRWLGKECSAALTFHLQRHVEALSQGGRQRCHPRYPISSTAFISWHT